MTKHLNQCVFSSMWVLFIALVAGQAHGVTLAHHDFETGDEVLVNAQILIRTGEIYAVRFDAPAYPTQLTHIRFFLGENGEKAQLGQCGSWHVMVWEDAGGDEPGNVLFDTAETEMLFELKEMNALQEIELAASGFQPIHITGPFRVGLKAEDTLCVLANPWQVADEKGFGALYFDTESTSGKNFMYRRNCVTQLEINECLAQGLPLHSWYELTALFPDAGDFVMEVEVNGPGGSGCNTNVDCDDGNTCTEDVCAAAICSNSDLDGVPCDDGNPCSTGDVCLQGTCTPGLPLECDDGDPCTLDTCDLGSGQCLYTPLSPCDPPARNTDVIGDVAAPDGDSVMTDSGPEAEAIGADGSAVTPQGDSTESGTPHLRLDGLTPSWGYENELTLVEIDGTGFGGEFSIRIGPTKLMDIMVISTTQARATVPEGLTPGIYNVYVRRDNVEVTLNDGFEIQAASSASEQSTGCSANHTPQSLPGWPPEALLVLLLAWSRRQPDGATPPG